MIAGKGTGAAEPQEWLCINQEWGSALDASFTCGHILSITGVGRFRGEKLNTGASESRETWPRPIRLDDRGVGTGGTGRPRPGHSLWWGVAGAALHHMPSMEPRL